MPIRTRADLRCDGGGVGLEPRIRRVCSEREQATHADGVDGPLASPLQNEVRRFGRVTDDPRHHSLRRGFVAKIVCFQWH